MIRNRQEEAKEITNTNNPTNNYCINKMDIPTEEEEEIEKERKKKRFPLLLLLLL